MLPISWSSLLICSENWEDFWSSKWSNTSISFAVRAEVIRVCVSLCVYTLVGQGYQLSKSSEMNEIVFPLLTMCAEPRLWRSSASSENQFLVPLLLSSPGTADVAKMFFSSASLRRDGRQGSESTPNILSSLTICSIFLKVGEGFLLLVNFSLG
jgi:hypothetical protein